MPPNAVHILGLADINAYAKGTLQIDGANIAFRGNSASARIPLASVTAFTVEQETKPLFRGNAGRLLLLAPFGSGRAISMIRTGVETLTLQYRDIRDGDHGCILMLPKGDGSAFAERLKRVGIREERGDDGTLPPPRKAPSTILLKERLANAKVQVDPIVGLPPEFRTSIYEQLIAALWDTGQFQHVYRSGDPSAETSAGKLHLEITGDRFQKGNERLRTLTTFGGATVIKVHLRIIDGAQVVVIEKDLQGSVRSYGENLDAAGSLVRKVARLLRPKA